MCISLSISCFVHFFNPVVLIKSSVWRAVPFLKTRQQEHAGAEPAPSLLPSPGEREGVQYGWLALWAQGLLNNVCSFESLMFLKQFWWFLCLSLYGGPLGLLSLVAFLDVGNSQKLILTKSIIFMLIKFLCDFTVFGLRGEPNLSRVCIQRWDLPHKSTQCDLLTQCFDFSLEYRHQPLLMPVPGFLGWKPDDNTDFFFSFFYCQMKHHPHLIFSLPAFLRLLIYGLGSLWSGAPVPYTN